MRKRGKGAKFEDVITTMTYDIITASRIAVLSSRRDLRRSSVALREQSISHHLRREFVAPSLVVLRDESCCSARFILGSIVGVCTIHILAPIAVLVLCAPAMPESRFFLVKKCSSHEAPDCRHASLF
jgi:hypothetical protein